MAALRSAGEVVRRLIAGLRTRNANAASLNELLLEKGRASGFGNGDGKQWKGVDSSFCHGIKK